MMNLHFVLCKVNANSNKLLKLLEPHSSFRCQYRLLTMTTFSEIASYLFYSILFYVVSLLSGFITAILLDT